jgi:rubrerythrin
VSATSARFARRRENFDCAHCGQRVLGTGYTNHCPACLWSRHVDVAPGDRLAQCGGLMEPIGVLFENGEHIVVQRCVQCGHLWRNRSSPGDDPAALTVLMGRGVPNTRKTRR